MIFEYFLIFSVILVVSGILGLLITRLSKNPIMRKICNACFFVGIMVHELSHYMVGRLTYARVKKTNIIPDRTERGGLMGSIQFHDTNFLQSILIGFAPLVVGTYIITFILQYVLEPTANYTIGLFLIYLVVSILVAIGPSKADIVAIPNSFKKHRNYATRQILMLLISIPIATLLVNTYEILLFDIFLTLAVITAFFYYIIKYVALGTYYLIHTIHINHLKFGLTKYKTRSRKRYKYKDDKVEYSPRTQW